MPAIRIYAGTPAAEHVAGSTRALVRDGDPLRGVADFILDFVSRPARDSGAALNLKAVYLNSRAPAMAGNGVRAIAERGVLQLDRRTVATMRMALSAASNGTFAQLAPSRQDDILRAVALLLHEGDHLAGAPFSRLARGTTEFGTVAAARNMEEGLAELRASQLLPAVATQTFGVQLAADAGARYWGLHQASAGIVQDAVTAASRNTGRSVVDITRELADQTPSTMRLARAEQLAGDHVSAHQLESLLAFQGGL